VMVWLEMIHAPGMPATGTASLPSWPTLAVLTLTLTVPVEVSGRIRWGLTGPKEPVPVQIEDLYVRACEGRPSTSVPGRHPVLRTLAAVAA